KRIVLEDDPQLVGSVRALDLLDRRACLGAKRTLKVRELDDRNRREPRSPRRIVCFDGNSGIVFRSGFPFLRSRRVPGGDRGKRNGGTHLRGLRRRSATTRREQEYGDETATHFASLRAMSMTRLNSL